MCDISSLTLPELRARMSECIRLRLESETPDGRARAGDELLQVLEELTARGCLDQRGGTELRPAVGDVPTPRASGRLLGELVLRAPRGGGVPAAVAHWSAVD